MPAPVPPDMESAAIAKTISRAMRGQEHQSPHDGVSPSARRAAAMQPAVSLVRRCTASTDSHGSRWKRRSRKDGM